MSGKPPAQEINEESIEEALPDGIEAISVPVRPKRVTLQDIADVAGVKKMVVSNALNGTRSVAPATRERVMRIAREMNYIPNFAARALTTGRTNLIAIMSGPLNHPYYAQMVHLLEGHVHSNGFNLLLLRTPDEVQELVNATGFLAVDGAIAVDMLGLVNQFRSHSHIPCVSIATVERSFVDNVLVDLSAAVSGALEKMVECRRARIAYLVTAPIMERASEVRSRTYRQVMAEVGRVPEIINVMSDDSESVEHNFRAYVEERGCPDALLCQNDETAMSAFRVLRAMGYKVPDDVLLAGCDGHPHMQDFCPPLSTIVQPMEAMCEAAWQFLERRMTQPDCPHQQAVFQGELVIRESLNPQP